MFFIYSVLKEVKFCVFFLNFYRLSVFKCLKKPLLFLKNLSNLTIIDISKTFGGKTVRF